MEDDFNNKTGQDFWKEMQKHIFIYNAFGIQHFRKRVVIYKRDAVTRALRHTDFILIQHDITRDGRVMLSGN